MVTHKPNTDAMPTTLRQAHELMPARNAPVGEWLAFRRRSADIYRRVADIDRDHHHEALYWAELETTRAEELAGQMHSASATAPKGQQT